MKRDPIGAGHLQGDLHIDLHIRVCGQSNGSRFYLKTLHISQRCMELARLHCHCLLVSSVIKLFSYTSISISISISLFLFLFLFVRTDFHLPHWRMKWRESVRISFDIQLDLEQQSSSVNTTHAVPRIAVIIVDIQKPIQQFLHLSIHFRLDVVVICHLISFFSPLSSSLSFFFFFFISFSSPFVLLSLHLSSLLVFDSITVPIRTLLRRLSCSAALMNIVKPSNCIRIKFDLHNRIAVRSNNYPVITNSYWYQ